jgi:hypothetical protein
LSLELYGERAVVKVDWGRVAAAAPLLTDPTDDLTVYAGSRGQVQGELRSPGKGQVALRFDVPEAVDFSWVAAGEPYGFSVAAGERVVDLALDATAVTPSRYSATLHLGLGAVSLTTPLDSALSWGFRGALSDPAHQHHPVRYELPGMIGQLDYDGSSDSLIAKGLGLGPSSSRLAYGRDTLLTLDVDPQGDRKLDLEVSASTNGELVTTLRPDLVLTLGYALDRIAAYVTGLPGFTRDDTLTLRLSDPKGASARLLLDANGELAMAGTQPGALLSVLEGQLAITSQIAPEENVAVGAGECLWREADGSGSHALLTGLFAGACR